VERFSMTSGRRSMLRRGAAALPEFDPALNGGYDGIVLLGP
jgi:hypothetical protein